MNLQGGLKKTNVIFVVKETLYVERVPPPLPPLVRIGLIHLISRKGIIVIKSSLFENVLLSIKLSVNQTINQLLCTDYATTY